MMSEKGTVFRCSEEQTRVVGNKGQLVTNDRIDL